MAVKTLGTPDGVLADGTSASTGVNAQAGVLLRHGAAQSVLHTSLLSNTPAVAVIAGDAAALTTAGAFYRPGPFVIEAADRQTTLTYPEPCTGYDGLAYQVAEMARRIVAAESSAPQRTVADSIATLVVVDEIRRQLGVLFDGETSER